MGGVAVSYIERAEPGSDYELENLLYNKLNSTMKIAYGKRFLWYSWMACAYYCLMLPFTAELAFIPIVGGCLLRWKS